MFKSKISLMKKVIDTFIRTPKKGRASLKMKPTKKDRDKERERETETERD